MASNYWIVTVPNEGKPGADVFNRLAGAGKDYGELTKVEMPSLQVGTLNSLMSLSDELVRIDLLVENMVRKIEKQHAEVAGPSAESLHVGTVPVKTYLEHFEWDYAKYASRQRLPALVAHIQSGVAKIEEELKNLASAYSEKTQLMQALKRKKGSNLASADLSEVLTEELVQGVNFVDTEHLVTLVVALQKNQEQVWLSTYATIGEDIAALGSPDWSNPRVSAALGTPDGQFGPEFSERGSAKGSPVVPGSSQKVLEDGDMCLYTVTILRGMYQAGFYDGEQFQTGMSVDYVAEFKRAAKDKRFVVREFSFDPEKAGESQRQEEQLHLETQQLHTGMVRWCKAHYGEAFVAWMHIKVIRTFVESVMRYGLPVDFSTLLVAPLKNKEKSMQGMLDEACAHMSALGPVSDSKDEDDKDDDYSAYVCNKFSIMNLS